MWSIDNHASSVLSEIVHRFDKIITAKRESSKYADFVYGDCVRLQKNGKGEEVMQIPFVCVVCVLSRLFGVGSLSLQMKDCSCSGNRLAVGVSFAYSGKKLLSLQ
jgi:hypothetical protein